LGELFAALEALRHPKAASPKEVGQLEKVCGRSLALLVKTRGFGMTPL
jgi:hypothetical protein